jgi:NAD(P)-dependent dehydrogenase (short-subunit alcohol dehydrogenase family)
MVSVLSWLSIVAASLLLLLLVSRLLPRATRSIHGLSVLVTGCDRGLGRDLALAFQSHHATVYAGCLTPAGVAALSSLSLPNLRPFLLDITTDASVTASVSFVQSSPPYSLDVLVNNAGVFDGFLLELTPVSAFQRCLDVNVLGTVRMSQACLPLLRRSRGRIVTIGSFLGSFSSYALSAYSVSKHGLEALHDSMRAEAALHSVQCSLVQPGTMRTALLQQVTKVYRELWEAGDKDVKAAYGEAWLLTAMPRISRIMLLLSTSTAAVVTVVIRSVQSECACSRYRVGLESWACWLLRFLPISDWMLDAVLAWLVGIPRPAAAPASAGEGEEVERKKATAG